MDLRPCFWSFILTTRQAFKFTSAGEEYLAGRTLEKVNFQHVPGMKSPAALALRGREYPLELSGTAWIDPDDRIDR